MRPHHLSILQIRQAARREPLQIPPPRRQRRHRTQRSIHRVLLRHRPQHLPRGANDPHPRQSASSPPPPPRQDIPSIVSYIYSRGRVGGTRSKTKPSAISRRYRPASRLATAETGSATARLQARHARGRHGSGFFRGEQRRDRLLHPSAGREAYGLDWDSGQAGRRAVPGDQPGVDVGRPGHRRSVTKPVRHGTHTGVDSAPRRAFIGWWGQSWLAPGPSAPSRSMCGTPWPVKCPPALFAI